MVQVLVGIVMFAPSTILMGFAIRAQWKEYRDE